MYSYFFRVLLCAVILIGGQYGLMQLSLALRGHAFTTWPDWSMLVSGLALFGLVGLVWWCSKPVSK